MNRASLAAVAALTIGLGVAHAQPAPNAAAADAALAEGRRLYDLQEWDKAIAKFKEAYTLRDDAPALFNIAQSYRLKRDCANAAQFYKTFKRKFPAEKVIAKVEKFIVEMDECAKTQVKPVEPPPLVNTPVEPPPVTVTAPVDATLRPPPPVTSSGPSGLRKGSYVAFSVGALGLVGGGVFALLANRAESDAMDVDQGEEWDPSIQSRGNRWKNFSRVGFVVGGAGVVAGVVMFVLSGTKTESAPQVGLVPEPGGGSFVWSGSF